MVEDAGGVNGFDPDDAGDLEIKGTAEHLGNRTLLEDGAVFHDKDPVGEGNGFVGVMGDDKDGQPGGVEKIAEFAADLGAGDEVEGGEGFIEEKQAGTADDGAGEGDALLLAPG